jgi:protein-tyrosine-phosphatase
VFEVMNEDGIDLSGKQPQSVFDLFKTGKTYDHVITVCHDSESRCPIFPGITKRWHLPFPDPAKVGGTDIVSDPEMCNYLQVQGNLRHCAEADVPVRRTSDSADWRRSAPKLAGNCGKGPFMARHL